MNETPLLTVRDLVVRYRTTHRASRSAVAAVDGVSFSIGSGETVGLVGESGSGKSTIGRAILGLAPVRAGAVEFAGKDITHAPFRARRALSADLQVVFQDPYGSLNPTRTIGDLLAEPVRVHERPDRAALNRRVADMLERVGLGAEAADRYPGGFSGGQRQRIAIARALMMSPRLVICDEPTSALDLSIQAQILNLLADLQSSLNVSYLFVSHDLAVVRHIAQKVIVLRLGRIVEAGDTDTVYTRPGHPYTRSLLDAIPTRRGDGPAPSRSAP
ncbi:ATP-binding cassette domain-containing protein [Streptomyces sp. NPDC055078]